MSLKDSLFNYTAGKGKSGSGPALLASTISINGRTPPLDLDLDPPFVENVIKLKQVGFPFEFASEGLHFLTFECLSCDQLLSPVFV